jgi:CDGSH-type Zn-finger protein
MANDTPKIACLPNGPCYLLSDSTPETIPNLQDARGNPCTTVTGVALCRCGGSSNKPFCDGSHGQNGFSDDRERDGNLDKRDNYVGQRITIHDNRGICSHAGYCTDNLNSVFKSSQVKNPGSIPKGQRSKRLFRQ